MRQRPRVRVGIVSWNTAGLLERCLAALPAALGDLDAEVVVVDNASADDSVAVARSYPGVVVLANDTNVGYGRGMNQALAHGGEGTDVLIALNPDTEPASGSVGLLVDRLLADPTVGLVVPRLVGADGDEQHSVYRFPSPVVTSVVSFVPAAALRRGVGQRYWLEGYSRHTDRVDIDWAIGAVHVIRTAALVGEPPYDETWFMYAEDLELCRRLADAGWRRRLEGDVEVVHVGNAAGVQAWGSTRTVRWLVPTYEWYERVHGPRAARAWAAVSLAGFLWLLPKWRLLARLRPRRFGEMAGWADGSAGAVAVHRAVVRGGVAAVADLAPAGHRLVYSEPTLP